MTTLAFPDVGPSPFTAMLADNCLAINIIVENSLFN